MSSVGRERFDVVVIGGGMGGVAAAVTAAGEGARTLIVEQSGQFGGVGTNCLITHFSQSPVPGRPSPTFVESLSRTLNDQGAVNGHQFSAESLVMLLDQLVTESGATPLFYTSMIGVDAEDGWVKRVQLHNKSGIMNVEGDVFIDSTGDGDLCVAAGADYEQGDGQSEFGQPMTLAFYMSGVDSDRIPSRAEINAIYDDARGRGDISNPRENVLMFEAVEPGTLLFNTTRIIHRRGLDGWDLTAATIEGRRQVQEMVNFVKKLPGFEKATLSRIANKIGVRETRRMACDYRLTYDDMLAGRLFSDSVLVTRAHLDIHNPHGSGTRFERLPEDVTYGVPRRCLIPRALHNVIIGSRCIGTSHEAFSAVRMMPHVAEYGRAAGFTAARALSLGCSLRETEPAWVQEKLATMEGWLDRDPQVAST